MHKGGRQAISGLVFLGILLLYFVLPLSEAYAAKDFLGPLQESKAYELYQGRQESEFSKLLFLLERFQDADAEIVYDGRHFSPKDAARIAKIFLVRKYKDELAEVWLVKWCYKTFKQGEVIWIKLPDGTHKTARELLEKEMQLLAITYEEDKKAALQKAAEAMMPHVTEKVTSQKGAETEAQPQKASPIEDMLVFFSTLLH